MTRLRDRLLPAARVLVDVRPVASIDVRGWDEIWRLSCRFYDADRPYVERRLKAQQQIALFRSAADGRLVGMAAIEVDMMSFEGRRAVVVFSSHAIAEERFRGQRLLQRALQGTVLRAWLEHPLKRRFLAFDAGGDHTGLLLPQALQMTVPPAATWEARLLAAFGRRKFGSAWQADGSIGHAAQKRLLPVAGLPPASVAADGATGDRLRLLPLNLLRVWALWRAR